MAAHFPILPIYQDGATHCATGFFLTSSGLAATAAHIADPAAERLIAHVSGQPVEAVIERHVPAIDLCLIRLEADPDAVFENHGTHASEGTSVRVTGYPSDNEDASEALLATAAGSVSSVDREVRTPCGRLRSIGSSASVTIENDGYGYLLGGRLESSYSGGPVTDKDGQLVGMALGNLSALLEDGSHGPEYGVVLSQTELRHALRDL